MKYLWKFLRKIKAGKCVDIQNQIQILWNAWFTYQWVLFMHVICAFFHGANLINIKVFHYLCILLLIKYKFPVNRCVSILQHFQLALGSDIYITRWRTPEVLLSLKVVHIPRASIFKYTSYMYVHATRNKTRVTIFHMNVTFCQYNINDTHTHNSFVFVHILL